MVKIFYKCFWPVLITCALVGCASFHDKPISPEQTASDLEQRTLKDPGLKAFIEANSKSKISHWPLKTWDFSKLMLVAFYYHPDLDVARAEWNVTKAGEKTAGESPNPTFGAGPGYNSSAIDVTPWIYGFNLDIPIETGGKRHYRISQAISLSEAARLNIITTAWKVRGRLRQNLVELYSANQKQDLLKKQQTIQEEIVKSLEQQLAAGGASQFEVNQAKISLSTTIFTSHDAESDAENARISVAESLGVPASALDKIKISFDGLDRFPSNLPPADVRKKALTNRSDILSSLAEYAASQAALQLEVAKQYPDIHLGPGYQYDQGDDKWSLGLTITLPVFSHNQGGVAEAEARREEMATRFNALQVGVLSEIDRALAGYQAAIKKSKAAEVLMSSQKDQEKTAQGMYEAGETSRFVNTTMQLEINSIALSRLDALVKAQQSLGQLEDAVQCPLTQTDSSPVDAQKNPRVKMEDATNEEK